MQLSSLTTVFLCSSECLYLVIHISFWEHFSFYQLNSEVKLKALFFQLVKEFLKNTQADVKTRNTNLLRKKYCYV